ncbi:hypothetical protein G0Q06_10545 [Puniceicoccales bacterium CK1056]|uniref:Uncharacterized protein n=1 Tax=Oceanipulchritudo coccoides TaxID=2706888 RepID=A0A6B2M5E9_9BACT|nr:hypothetical protein [Oceanipulchritudo coccoides]NDV62890.1 hypothetical protein [Oceanipulchritudo coccoides]
MKTIHSNTLLPLFPARLLSCWLIILALPGALSAGVIAGGGGTCGGGAGGSVYALNGTIGQPLVETSADGPYVLRSGFWNVVLIVQLPPAGDGFTNWMNSLAPVDKPPEGLRGPLDEPAGDGVSNLFKYAFGLLPLESSPDAWPHLASHPDPSNPAQFLLAVEFIRSTTAEVVFWMDGSPDLEVWTEAPFTLEVMEVLPDERERIRLVSTVSLLPGERYFLQLNVDLP